MKVTAERERYKGVFCKIKTPRVSIITLLDELAPESQVLVPVDPHLQLVV
jgi:hypothetical protein